MKTIVIYQTNTGFAKEYANLIGENLGCQCKSVKETSKKLLLEFDNVIFCGWVMGGMIMGLSKILKMTDKVKCVFAVGITPARDGTAEKLKKQNNLFNIPLFYGEGGLRFDKLSFFQKKMLNMVKNFLSKKENKNDEEIYMINTLEKSANNFNEKYIISLTDYIKQL